MLHGNVVGSIIISQFSRYNQEDSAWGTLHFLFLEYVDMRALEMARENKVEMRGLAQIRMSITGNDDDIKVSSPSLQKVCFRALSSRLTRHPLSVPSVTWECSKAHTTFRQHGDCESSHKFIRQQASICSTAQNASVH